MQQLHTALGQSGRLKTKMYTTKDQVLHYNNSSVDFYPTKNQGGEIEPKFLVIHFTAGSLDAHGTAAYFQSEKARASAHLTIGTDGTTVQNVAFNRKSWHAGKSQWAGYYGLNNHSIGIEVCNPGPLTITNTGYKTWWGKTIVDGDIIEAPHPNNPNGEVFGWIPFTEEQNMALLGIGEALFEEYRLLECVGHDMISPHRKFDPGPCMNYRIYDRLNNIDGDYHDEFHVTGVKNYLNARSGPGTDYAIIDKLDKGTLVEVISRQGVWWFVETKTGQQAWCHSKFLAR